MAVPQDYLDFMANFIEQKREAEEDLLDGDIDFSTEPGLGQWESVLLGGSLGNAAGGSFYREPLKRLDGPMARVAVKRLVVGGWSKSLDSPAAK